MPTTLKDFIDAGVIPAKLYDIDPTSELVSTTQLWDWEAKPPIYFGYKVKFRKPDASETTISVTIEPGIPGFSGIETTFFASRGVTI